MVITFVLVIPLFNRGAGIGLFCSWLALADEAANHKKENNMPKPMRIEANPQLRRRIARGLTMAISFHYHVNYLGCNPLYQAIQCNLWHLSFSRLSLYPITNRSFLSKIFVPTGANSCIGRLVAEYGHTARLGQAMLGNSDPKTAARYI
jgi:hypothetical protein